MDAEAPEADVLIHPDLAYYASLSLAFRLQAIAARAEAATLAALSRIRSVIAAKKWPAPSAAELDNRVLRFSTPEEITPTCC